MRTPHTVADVLSAELVERMITCVRGLAAHWETADPIDIDRRIEEARAIVAELPAPVDPDLIEAREVVCGYHHDKHPESPWHVEQAAAVRAGVRDSMLDVQAALFGIKRGRELAALAREQGKSERSE